MFADDPELYGAKLRHESTMEQLEARHAHLESQLEEARRKRDALKREIDEAREMIAGIE
jgi:prefoldin subunit 5